MRAKRLLALLIPLACAALFVRLGVWQLARHQERVAFNAGLAERLAAAPVPLEGQASDTVGARWTQVTVSGFFRYDLEQIHASRISSGSPGVHLLTPLERPGHDTLLVVTRGWVYSADASSAELPRWREGAFVTISGYLVPMPDSGPPLPEDRPTLIRSLHRKALETRLGKPVYPVQLVMTSDSAARADSVPRRLPLPSIDMGPHRSYAAQWFAFAIIAVVGGIVLFRRTRGSI
ncbi:SURF1 family protein [Pseudogemmatithrix spongiicola]|uniref:SURF1-like protein n=1 Tax=Pseudogemmatithrix spongiicola TaxID=3062599 RepID=A0AA49Q7V0_9BACT|nr:SURF1 family protein [Gemmatimonadaceae bacterium 'strain 138']WKW16108.1 SURF1 family protein [Gemmatimonadaceae bacterium 'strain 318']